MLNSNFIFTFKNENEIVEVYYTRGKYYDEYSIHNVTNDSITYYV